MSTISIIKDELDNNVSLYGSMTDQEVADELNDPNKPRNRTSMTGSEIWEQTDSAQFANLTNAKKTQWLALCGIDTFNPFGPVQAAGVDIFDGVAGNTGPNIGAARVETVSQAEILGIGGIELNSLIGWVTEARAL